MSLAPCRECGELVSPEAETCPKCGIKKPTKAKKKSRLGLWVLLGLVAAAIIANSQRANTPSTVSTPAPQAMNATRHLPKERELSSKSGSSNSTTARFLGIEFPPDTTLNDPQLVRRQSAMLGLDPNATLADAKKDFSICVMRSVARNEGGIKTMEICADFGVMLCNKEGQRTPWAIAKSAVTGRVLIENPECRLLLETAYLTAKTSFQAELENYAAAESYGAPYTPVLFDIRSVVGGWKQPTEKQAPVIGTHQPSQNKNAVMDAPSEKEVTRIPANASCYSDSDIVTLSVCLKSS